jgi:hypothetical protein
MSLRFHSRPSHVCCRHIYVCRTFKTVSEGGPWYKYTAHGRWEGKTAGGCTNDPSRAQFNPQYYLNVSKPANIFVVLTQEEVGKARDGLTNIGIKLLNKKGNRCKAVYAGQQLAATQYEAFRQSSLEYKFTPQPTPLTLFVSTFEAGQERTFELTVFSDVPLDNVDGASLRQIPESVPAS